MGQPWYEQEPNEEGFAEDPLAGIPVDLYHLIPGFLERRRREVAELEDLLEEGDFHSIKALGHKLKGTGAGYGFPGITVAGRELEKAAAAQDASGVKARIGELSRLVRDILQHFNRNRDENE